MAKCVFLVYGGKDEFTVKGNSHGNFQIDKNYY